MKKHEKVELQQFLSNQFHKTFNQVNTARMSVSFWSKAKRKIIPSHSSIHALVTSNVDLVKDRKSMCDIASKY
jgi:hypothetical protein